MPARGEQLHQPVFPVTGVQAEGKPDQHRSRRNAESDTYPLIDPCHVEDDEHHEDGQQAAREDEEVLRLQAPELHALADSLVDSIFHNYLHDRLDYKKKERRIVAATIRKIHAPNQLAAVFDVSGSPLESSRSAPLRELSPLRTVRASFPAYGSSNMTVTDFVIGRAISFSTFIFIIYFAFYVYNWYVQEFLPFVH